MGRNGSLHNNVTLFIVDPWQYWVFCIKSGVTRRTLLMVPVRTVCAWTVWASAGYTRCSGRRSVHLCAASLQNLAVPQDFYSPCSVPLEWSCWPCIRWWGAGGFQEQSQCFLIGLSCSIITIVFYYLSLSLLSVYRLVLYVLGLRTDRYTYHSLSAVHYRPCLNIFYTYMIIDALKWTTL